MSECPFESDVMDALASHRWPGRVGAELQAHVAVCAACRDLAAVAGALLHDGDAAFSAANVPSAGSVWHRSQLRAREEAARAATRPIGFVQGVAFACGLAAAIGLAVWGLPLAGAILPDGRQLLSSLRGLSVPMPALDLDAPAVLMNTTVQLALAAWAVAATLAFYFAVRDTSS